MSVNCPVCDCGANFYLKLYDDRYGYPGDFSILQCFSCKHKFIEKNVLDNIPADIYTTHYGREKNISDDLSPLRFNKGIRSWLNGESASVHFWVPENITVLDIGCGKGESLLYHKLRGCTVYGVETDENVIEPAKKAGIDIYQGQFSSKDHTGKTYDYITLNQVVEHIKEPGELLSELKNILDDDGRVILSTPNSAGWGRFLFRKKWINWHVPYHIHFFNQKSLLRLCKQSGFDIEHVSTPTSSNWFLYQLFHLVSYPDKGVPSAFWSGRRNYSFSQKLIIKLSLILHRLKITHLISKLFDVAGVGDNMLVILKKNTM